MSIPEPLPPHIATAERPALTMEFQKLITHYRGEASVKPILRSRALGLKGSPDLMIDTPKRVVVVEWKTSSPWASKEHVKAQLTTYALIAREVAKKEVIAIAATTTEYKQIKWQKTVPQVLKAVRELKTALRTENPPEPSHDRRRCRNCPYRHACPW